MFDDHKNEEPGWREYWQSGGDARKLNKQPHPKMKKTIFISLIALLIIISIYSIIKNPSSSVKPITETDKDLYNIATGQKTVTKEMQAYLDNVKSYIHSVDALATNLNKNFLIDQTFIDKDIYKEYDLNYNIIIDFPAELKEYESALLEKYNNIHDIIPDKQVKIPYDQYIKIIEIINTSGFNDILAEYLDKYGYYHTYDEETGYLEYRIKKKKNPY